MADRKKKNIGALSTETAAAKLTKKMSSFSVSTQSLGRSSFSTEKDHFSQPVLKQHQQQPRNPLQQSQLPRKSLQQEPGTQQRKPLQQLQQQQQIPQRKLSQQNQQKPLLQKKSQQQQQQQQQKKPQQQQHREPLQQKTLLQRQSQKKTLQQQQPLAQRKTQQQEIAPPSPAPPAPRPQRNDVLNESARETLDSINRRLAALEGTQRGMREMLKQFKNTTNSVDERLKKMERKVTSIYNILKQLTDAQSSAARTRPEYLPFKTTADVVAFDHLADDKFDALIHYLRYLGGANEVDAAANYFKACFKFGEDLFRNMTWHGSKSDNQILALKDTRFALACNEAMPIMKEILRKPNKGEFATAMTKALKSAKESYRRERKRVAPPIEQPVPVKRQRQNHPPQNNAAADPDDDNESLFEDEQQQPIIEQQEQQLFEDAEQPNDGDQHIEELQFDDTQLIEETVGEEGEGSDDEPGQGIKEGGQESDEEKGQGYKSEEDEGSEEEGGQGSDEEGADKKEEYEQDEDDIEPEE